MPFYIHKRKILSNVEKKTVRLENKKRKWKALLDIWSQDDDGNVALKKQNLPNDAKRQKNDSANFSVENQIEAIQMSLDRMRQELKGKQKVKMLTPVFNLKEVGEKAKFTTKAVNDVSLLVIDDIQHLILTSLIGSMAPVTPRWCQLQKVPNITGVVLLVVEGISVKDYAENIKCFTRIRPVFDSVVQFVPLQPYSGSLIEEILWFPVVTSTKCTTADVNQVTQVEKISSEESRNVKSIPVPSPFTRSVEDVFPRTSLLLSPEQMLLEGYPLILPAAKPLPGYVFSKEKYAPVLPYSPLIGIDCEMCLTLSGNNELTRISVVNEKLEVIYETLVKPWNTIVDYLTVYSGITKEMLVDVNTRLEDVQKDLRRLLPPDAILCGHSLNSDLHAMKMIHPYVIDTSYIYNLRGTRKLKSSLKNLVKTFLKVDIQVGSNGHDSIEDSRSTLQLVQLKLKKGIDYGDDAVCRNPAWKCEAVKAKQAIFSRNSGFVTSLIGQIVLHNKKVAIVSCSDLTGPEMPPELNSSNDSITTLFNLSSSKDVVQNSMQLATENDLTIAHLQMCSTTNETEKNETSFFTLDKLIKKMHSSLVENSLCIVVFASSSENCSESHSDVGLCMIKLKEAGC